MITKINIQGYIANCKIDKEIRFSNSLVINANIPEFSETIKILYSIF